jgi:hypothetical protein
VDERKLADALYVNLIARRYWRSTFSRRWIIHRKLGTFSRKKAVEQAHHVRVLVPFTNHEPGDAQTILFAEFIDRPHFSCSELRSVRTAWPSEASHRRASGAAATEVSHAIRVESKARRESSGER